jgi:adenosine deaminase
MVVFNNLVKFVIITVFGAININVYAATESANIQAITQASSTTLRMRMNSTVKTRNELTMLTANYYTQLKDDADYEALYNFLARMPKGADLHSHLTGTSLAENLFRYGHGEGFCISSDYKALKESNCPDAMKLDNIESYSSVQDKTVDAWSMRQFKHSYELGHDHFFAAFPKFSPVAKANLIDALSEVRNKAGRQNELYLELMAVPDGNMAAQLGESITWNGNLNTAYAEIMHSRQVGRILSIINLRLVTTDNKVNAKLKCNSSHPEPGCQVVVKYIYEVRRNQKPESVFSQLVVGFEAMKHDKNIVGITLMQPEDAEIAMRDYTLHMQMIEFLKHKYPQANVSLHAGELTGELVPESGLKFHVYSAVEIAGSNRIGHATDIIHEDNYRNLLQKMANRHILVEVLLSSNADILDVHEADHSLPMLLKYKVPVALATDDEGVLRTNLSEQFLIAAKDYDLAYLTLKDFARNSLEYSFLPGQSLWRHHNYSNPVVMCRSDYTLVHPKQLTSKCRQLLQNNQKAQLQWRLEQEFVAFEESIASTLN